MFKKQIHKIKLFSHRVAPAAIETVTNNEADDDYDVDEALRMSRRKSIDLDSNSTSKRNKIYLHIKREIELREKTKPTTDCSDQVTYVYNAV